MQKIYNGKDGKHTNVMDISIIWLYWMLYCRPYCRLYWRLFCRLYCRLYWKLFCRLYWRLLFIMQYLFFSFFHKCSKFMALSDASRLFFPCYYFFLFFCHFFIQHKIQEETRFGLSLRSPLACLKVKKKMDPIFEHPVFDSAKEKMKCFIR